ncbi:MAG: hypothetical protein RJB13_1943, partial [Pseudomonadota bacterium]
MSALWRVIRRIAFLFVAMIVAANTIAFVVLNNGLVHDWFREEINEGFAKKFGLQVDLGTISLNVIESTIHVENVSVYSLQSRDIEFAHLQKVTLGFEFFSSLPKWYPQPRFLRVSDWQIDLAILDQIKKNDEQPSSDKVQLEKVLIAVKNYVGPQIEIRAGRFLDTRRRALLEQMNVDSLFMRIAGLVDTAEVSVIGEFGRAVLCIRRDESCLEKSKIDELKTNLVLKSKANVRVEQVSVDGDFGQWNATGEMLLDQNNEFTSYVFRLQGDARASPWFSLAGMSGQGNFGASLRLFSQSSSQYNKSESLKSPQIEGRLSWRDLSLSGFDIYTGSADFSYSNLNIFYKNARIITPQGALIEARGNYSFEKTKPFVNYAKFRGFHFNELMRGLRVPTDAVDFKMDTDDVVVLGEISPEGDRGYTLVAEGPIKAERMISPSFENGQRSLPDCLVQLKLDTNKKRMTFAGSGLTCSEPISGSVMPVELQKGRIDYINSTTEFQFTAANAPASIVSYFVGEDLSGNMGFRGKIYSSPVEPTNFTADVQVNNGRVFDLNYSRLSTRIYLDATKIKCSQTEAWFNEERPSPNVVLDQFEFNFKRKNVKINGSFDGELSDIFAAAGRTGGAIARDLDGQLNISRMSLNGRLNELAKAEIDVVASAKNITHPFGNARNMNVRVFCQLGLCTGSRVFAQDLGLGGARAANPLRNNARLNGLLSSSAIIEVESFTGRSLSLRASLASVPFSFQSKADPQLSGILDFTTAVQGDWDNWELSLRSRIDSFKYDKVALGSVSLTGSSIGGGPVSIVVAGLNDQVQSRFVFDHDLSSKTQMYLSLRSFDVFRYLRIED